MSFTLFKRAGDAELDALLDEFGVWNKRPLDVASAFGRVYFGQYGGRPVALKIEERDSGSSEYTVLQRLRDLRAGAPGDIKAHLPIVYAIGQGSKFSYYAMEVLRPVDSGIARVLFSDTWSVDSGSISGMGREDLSAADRESYFKKLLVMDPAFINREPHGVIVGEEGESLGDAELVAAAFEEWWGHVSAGLGSRGRGDSGTAFKQELLAGLSGVFKELGGSLGARSRASVGDIAELAGSRVMARLSGGGRAAFRVVARRLPELIFAIIKTGWLPRYREEQREHVELVPYDTLARSVSGLDSGMRVTLRRALDWLAEHGVLAGDLHSGNLMERPGTGEYVLIDYGYYKLATSDD